MAEPDDEVTLWMKMREEGEGQPPNLSDRAGSRPVGERAEAGRASPGVSCVATGSCGCPPSSWGGRWGLGALRVSTGQSPQRSRRPTESVWRGEHKPAVNVSRGRPGSPAAHCPERQSLLWVAFPSLKVGGSLRVGTASSTPRPPVSGPLPRALQMLLGCALKGTQRCWTVGQASPSLRAPVSSSPKWEK